MFSPIGQQGWAACLIVLAGGFPWASCAMRPPKPFLNASGFGNTRAVAKNTFPRDPFFGPQPQSHTVARETEVSRPIMRRGSPTTQPYSAGNELGLLYLPCTGS